MRELRCIVFSEHEVLMAIIEQRERVHEKLPPGTVRDIAYDIEGNGPLVARVTIVSDSGKKHVVKIQALELGIALVGYCLRQKVPLPMSASKWIEVIEGVDLTLVMAVEPERASRDIVTEEREALSLPRQGPRRL